jgi:putative ABC transport system permease protein
MPFLNDLRFRLRALFRRNVMDRELDAELGFHIEQEAAKHIRAGKTPDEARRLARASFGGMERIKDDTRDARGLVALETLAQDLRYAVRGLAANPIFTAGVVVTLGLGIGANAAMFGIVDRLLFRSPQSMKDADRVHRLYRQLTIDSERNLDGGHAFPTYLDFRQNAKTIEEFAAFQTRQLAIGEGEETREMRVTLASASFFSFFNARPALGRFFDASDDSIPAGRNVVVLGHAFWQTRFGGSRDAIGKTIRVDRTIYEVIGVAPDGFVGMHDQGVPAAFIPITSYAYNFRGANYPGRYGWSWLEIIARRKPDVSATAAQTDLSLSYVATYRKMIASDPGWGTIEEQQPAIVLGPVQTERGPQAGRDSRVAAWISGVALIVLLIACANVANLLLSRAVGRQREIAVRLALGVSRGRLVRQLLTESFVLAFLGGLAGLVVGQWGSSTLRTFFFTAEETISVATDTRTLLFALLASIVTALLTGLVPALQAGRGDLATALKSGSREGTYRRGRTRTGLLILQATLSVVLLVGAGLFVRSLQNVNGYRMGYDIDRIVVAGANMRGARLNAGEMNALNERMLVAVRQVPGVTHASLAASIPFWSNEGRGLWVPGVDTVGRRGRFVLQAGSPDYFATTGTRILRGRPFDATDRTGGPGVVVVSEGMARAIWGSEEAIGKCIRIGADTAPCTEVIGIAEEVRIRALADAREFSYYVPAAQYIEHGEMYPQMFVRVRGDVENMTDVIRLRLQRELPGAAYANAMPLDKLIDPQRRAWKFGATMFVAFGGLALVLAAIGLYSLIAYDVAQRTQELGVRLALGASMSDVMRLVMSSGIRLVAVGVILGAGLAFWGSKWMEGLMFRQSPRDPLVFGVVALVLLAVSLVASSAPALRASRVDPNVALRGD